VGAGDNKFFFEGDGDSTIESNNKAFPDFLNAGLLILFAGGDSAVTLTFALTSIGDSTSKDFAD
jgi:hypothetical protein